MLFLLHEGTAALASSALSSTLSPCVLAKNTTGESTVQIRPCLLALPQVFSNHCFEKGYNFFVLALIVLYHGKKFAKFDFTRMIFID